MAEGETPSLTVTDTRVSPARVLAATGGLIVGGSVAGAVAGMGGAVLLLALNGDLSAAFHPAVLGFSGALGGLLGAVIMPIAGFTLLRYVPLWRAFLETTIMTAIGGVIGVQFMSGMHYLNFDWWWLLGPIGGFTLAAVRLWHLARRNRRLAADST